MTAAEWFSMVVRGGASPSLSDTDILSALYGVAFTATFLKAQGQINMYPGHLRMTIYGERCCCREAGRLCIVDAGVGADSPQLRATG